jgi:hypothetical protein
MASLAPAISRFWRADRAIRQANGFDSRRLERALNIGRPASQDRDTALSFDRNSLDMDAIIK